MGFFLYLAVVVSVVVFGRSGVKNPNMVHLIHDFIGDLMTLILSAIFVASLLVPTFFIIQAAFVKLFGKTEQLPVIDKSVLAGVPLGAPADGGNYVWDGHGWVHLNDADTETVRSIMKVAAGTRKRDAMNEEEGWDVLMEESQPRRSNLNLEALNDIDGDYEAPDDDGTEYEYEQAV